MMFTSGNQRGIRKCSFENLEDRRLMAVDVDNSVFDPDVFAGVMDGFFSGNAMGYSFAVNYDGVVIAGKGSDGQARTDNDSPALSFTEDTESEVASVSKIITTVATLKLLEQRYGDVNVGLDQSLISFLPDDWDPGNLVEQVTIRHLLRHTSGLYEGGGSDPANGAGINFEVFANNSTANLKSLVEADLQPSSAGPFADPEYSTLRWNRSYNNANISLLSKVVIPKLLDWGQDFSAQGLNDIGITANDVDSYTGQMYSDYVNVHVFFPAGFWASMDINENSLTNTMAYANSNDTTPGMALRDEMPTGGAVGWKLSAKQLARFLDAIQHDNSVLSPAARAIMMEQDLGWSPQGSTDISAQRIVDAFGFLHNHGGLRGNTNAPGLNEKFNAEIMVFPGDVEASVVMNSTEGELPLGSIEETLHMAYTNAWTDITFDGTFQDDTFEVQVTTAGGQEVLELRHNGIIQFQHWTSTLDSLTINGLNGNDEFFVHSIPDGMELNINGGWGADEVEVSWVAGNLETVKNLDFNGGRDVDTLTLNDSSVAEGQVYAVTSTHVSRDYETGIPATPIAQLDVDFSRVENLVLDAGSEDDSIYVGSTTSLNTTVNAGSGNDTLVASLWDGDMELMNGLVFNGGGGEDSITVNDTNNTYDLEANHIYGVTSTSLWRGYQTGDSDDPIGQTSVDYHDVENLTLQTGDEADSIHVGSTTSLLTTIESGDGDDDLYASPGDGNMEFVNGLTFDGQDGTDSLVVNDLNNPYGNDLSHEYEINPINLSRGNSLPGPALEDVVVSIGYFGLENLTLTTGSESDTIEVHGLTPLGSSSTIAATFNTGGGDDTLVVTPNDGNMEYVDGLQFNGGAGSDSVIVHDENNPYSHGMSHNYAVNSNAVSRYAQNPVATQWAITIKVGLDDVEVVELHAGAEADTISVSNTESLETVSVYGGNPTHHPGDVLHLSAPAGAATSWSPSTTEIGAGQAMIDDTMINYWEIEQVEFNLPVPSQANVAFGDYNRSGVVDAADYVVARMMFGATVTPYSSADGNGDGTISDPDLQLWRDNFGQVMESGSKAIADDAKSASKLAPVSTSSYRPLMEPSVSEDSQLNESSQNLLKTPASFPVAAEEPAAAGRLDMAAPRRSLANASQQDVALLAWLSSTSRDRFQDSADVAQFRSARSAEALGFDGNPRARRAAFEMWDGAGRTHSANLIS